MTGGANVFTIPAGMPFVDALAAGLRHRVGDDAAALTRVRVLLPNRRACRALAEAFLRHGGGRPLLLPRISPIGDVDEDELAFSGAGENAGGEAGTLDMAISPAVPDLRRLLLLTRLILAIPGGRRSPDQAARLAAELARFLDAVRIEGLDFAGLRDLAPDALAEHWQMTLDFLSIVTDAWPMMLDAEGGLDAAERRNRLLYAQAEAWTADPPSTPVIAAGSTGTIPASAHLIGVISRLPHGAVVLPGLDQDADDETWAALTEEPTHPQYGMARLLARLDVDRRQVVPWPAPGIAATAPERASLINRALRPAATVDGWRRDPPIADAAVAGVSILDAPGPDEEARAIALLMRSVLEDEERRAALVTPDRALARRVAAELERWGIAVDDSAGRPLAETPQGAYLRLIARMAGEALAPVPLLAALKHPLAACSLPPQAFRALVRRLEERVLRGPRPEAGITGLSRSVADHGADLVQLVDRLGAVLDPLLEMVERPVASLADLVQAHVAAAEAVAASDQQPGRDRLWAGDAGEASADFVADLTDAADDFEPLAPRHYPALLDSLMAGRVVRPRYGRHPRLSIWGPLEARLQRADVMILGGLNEETWPPRAAASPWMSRPMMQAFGLPLPERRIGLSAHDFTQAFSAPEVWLTRARRIEGAPTVECRWLSRLRNIVGDGDAGRRLSAGGPWLDWQARLDTRDAWISIAPPAPTPPVSARPRRLSVTQIESWMRDPYAIYARHILTLKALQPIDMDPTAADLGTFMHLVLQRFIEATPGALPEDAEARLTAIGEEAWRSMPPHAAVRAFWWPRFRQTARWFLEVERERRAFIRSTLTEVSGSLVVDAPEGPFALVAKADRVDILDGQIVIVDYKTGQLPSGKDIAAGFSPQLPLEAAIARAGGFPGVPAGTDTGIEYWRLRGGAEGGTIKPVKNADMLAEQALAGLVNLVARFDVADTPYPARPRPSAAPRFSDYEHLARVKEWSAGGREEGD
ncbi:MAG: double-strand break repair protein AddB [Rhodospirillales bacterium]|nr:double-strand break repair protein AddB [Rhodospirillales bacterium]